jgi:cytochrome b pre-mRNA-processing protein 3
MLKALRRLGDRKRLSEGLFAGLTARAREPLFFLELGVPDTIDGRFDLLTLHAWLVLERLAAERDLSQALTDTIFVQFDESLRQLGVGDIGIGHRVKKMADAFYGRLKAYREAKDESELAAAIQRNIYRGEASAAQSAQVLALYATQARAQLADADIVAGALDFGPLPIPAEARAS